MYCTLHIKIQKYYSLFHIICISTKINDYQSLFVLADIKFSLERKDEDRNSVSIILVI